jgi:DNA mismatch endonuclease (patch repair protein)
MADVVSSETRSRMMSGIPGKNTKPEQMVRKALFAAGFRFRLHRRDLPGVPDVALPGSRVAIFVHGCFWHLHRECRYAKLPSTRPDFWKQKLEGNALRDSKNIEALLALGWRVFVVWECATRKKAAGLPEALAAWIEGGETWGELPTGPTDNSCPP